MKKNEIMCIDSSRTSDCVLCKPVAKHYKELERVIANLNALSYDDIMYELDEEVERLNANIEDENEWEVVNVEDVIYEYTHRYDRLCDEMSPYRKKLRKECGKCDDLNYKVKVILVEAEFVAAKVALDIAAKKFDYLDEDKFLSYYA